HQKTKGKRRSEEGFKIHQFGTLLHLESKTQRFRTSLCQKIFNCLETLQVSEEEGSNKETNQEHDCAFADTGSPNCSIEAYWYGNDDRGSNHDNGTR
ncbi:unnamed protein product, partial [Citrullus colocynthis]